MLNLSYEEWIDVSKGANYIEFDWIGIDNQEQIAIFSSVGMGYIPPKVLSSYESYIGLANILYHRDKFTSAEIISKETGKKDHWRDWAQKGLFAYDYYDIHRMEKFERYDLIAVPGVPLKVGVIPGVNVFYEVMPRFDLAFGANITMSQLKGSEL